MEVDKIRNTTDAELAHQQHELAEQLFRLRFQLKMGQTESLKKLRGLRKDIARIKTVVRERELGKGQQAAAGAAAEAAAPVAKSAPAAKAAKRSVVAASAHPAKKAAGKVARKKTEKK